MKHLFCILSLLTLFGCVSYDNFYKLDEHYQERRQMETRRFEAKNEEEMLVSVAQVLQDLDFTLETTETELGIITGTKVRDVTPTGAQVAIILLAGIGKTTPVYDVRQKIYATVISNKSKTNPGFNVRVKFARIVWNNRNESRLEKLEDESLYKNFFDKLSQSLFLTANDL
ncbi:MAG: hypothetical protein MJ158_02275 [Alphaproteobacteria bacterium]|nr:hypothetical protein [Alphaproteobacteria bacterium]